LGAKDHGAFVKNAHPKVLAVTGPHAAPEVMAAVHLHLPKPHDPFIDLVPPQGIKLTPKHYAYLKISEGCNHRCTFCIIPSLRGELVSRPLAQVMQEAENLVKAGVKELLVISQDTSAYGVDVKYRTGFWRGRPLKTCLTGLCPEITIRSTFITGFAGETEAEFSELLAFLDEAQLDRVGCFSYSPVEGAAANTLPDPVPEELKEQRRRRFMEKQAKISAAKLA